MSRCPFGPSVSEDRRAAFFRRLAPWVDNLATGKMDMGHFHDPRYAMRVELKDLTPVN